jgi:hypothetical protein
LQELLVKPILALALFQQLPSCAQPPSPDEQNILQQLLSVSYIPRLEQDCSTHCPFSQVWLPVQADLYLVAVPPQPSETVPSEEVIQLL